MDVAHAPPPLPPEPSSNHFLEAPLPAAHDAPPLPADNDANAPPLPPEEPDEPAAGQSAGRQPAEPGAEAGAGPGSANGAPLDLLTAEMDPEEDPLLVAEARHAAEGEAGDGPPAEEPMWPAEDPDAVKLSTEEEEALLKVRMSLFTKSTGRCPWRVSTCAVKKLSWSRAWPVESAQAVGATGFRCICAGLLRGGARGGPRE